MSARRRSRALAEASLSSVGLDGTGLAFRRAAYWGRDDPHGSTIGAVRTPLGHSQVDAKGLRRQIWSIQIAISTKVNRA
jgi:hypothetical protein